jgi:hypothetical protein
MYFLDLAAEQRIISPLFFHSIAFQTEAVLGIPGYPDLVGKFDEKIRETPIVAHPKL